MLDGAPVRRGIACGCSGDQVRPHLVNTYGRSLAGIWPNACRTMSSEWPRP